MSKRNMVGYRLPRKKRKAGVSYAKIDLDVPEELGRVEDIRVWNITRSETNGRVSATRKTHQHIYASPLDSPHKDPPAAQEIAPEDPEPREVESVAKKKRVRAVKENDSVSSIPPILMPQPRFIITTPADKDGGLACVPFNCAG